MAELLIYAKDHWMDSLTQNEVNALSIVQKQFYDKRYQKGDVVCIRPDGWEWGKEETLPNFVVLKVPGVSVDELKEYNCPLIDSSDINNIKILKKSKYRFQKAQIDSAINLDIKSITINKTNFLSKLETKVI